jgi:hypothetical protein
MSGFGPHSYVTSPPSLSRQSTLHSPSSLPALVVPVPESSFVRPGSSSSPEPSLSLFSSPPFPSVPSESSVSLPSQSHYAPKGLLQSFFTYTYNSAGKQERVSCRLNGCRWKCERVVVSTTNLWRHLFSKGHEDIWNEESLIREVLVHVWYCSRSAAVTRSRCVYSIAMLVR